MKSHHLILAVAALMLCGCDAKPGAQSNAQSANKPAAQAQAQSQPQSPATTPAVIKPSFDCAKAASKAEKLICSDAGLAALDLRMATLYKNLRTADPETAADLAAGQKEWVKETQSQCGDIDCLRAGYDNRVAELEQAHAVKCDAARIDGKNYSLTCHTRDDPAGFTITVSGERDDDVTLQKLAIRSPQGASESFPLEGDLSTRMLKSDGVALIDINFDGHRDLRVMTGLGNVNASYDYWLYDAAAKKFTAFPQGGEKLSGVDISMDASTKTIRASARGSCCSWEVSTYRWVGKDLAEQSTEKTQLAGDLAAVEIPLAGTTPEICAERTETLKDEKLLSMEFTRADQDCDPKPAPRAWDQALAMAKKNQKAGYSVSEGSNSFTIRYNKPQSQ